MRARYEQLNQKLQQLHGLLDDAEAALPNCPVTDTSCQASWRSVLEKLHEMTSERTFMHACPGVSEAARKFGDYASEHMKALSERERQLNDRIAALAMGQAAEKRLAELREAVRAAKPIPCLSFACSDW